MLALPLLTLLALAGGSVTADGRDHHGNLLDEKGEPVHVNRLIVATSPYLRQHAHNPVQWYEWGEEAFEKARTENKPIFLSVGYSTCHWCHVMARESFSDDEVAWLLNDLFVPVKLDREERPDVDDVYMRAVQLLRRRGGWPLSAWLTPELEPFAGGTYYPKFRFIDQLETIADRWSSEEALVRNEARLLARRVKQRLEQQLRVVELADDTFSTAIDGLWHGFDQTHGGWRTPKFPNESSLLYLLWRWQRDGDPRSLQMARKTLDAMQVGGIHDQVGGGFARYAVDARWLVPHFEKMLYNQAWLGQAYVEAHRLTGDVTYRRSAEGIYRYALRDMLAEGGAFYSAEDADSEGEEGKFYVWRPSELVAALGAEDAALFSAFHGVSPGGNFPEHPGASILTAPKDPVSFATARKMKEPVLHRRLQALREKLVAVRGQRIRPERDEKILCDWNGFFIASLARAARVLGDPKLEAAAARAATFVLRELRDDEGRLLHQWADGRASGPAFLDDHLALVDGLLELHETSGDEHWLTQAKRLHAEAREQFLLPGGAWADTGSRHQKLLARNRDGYDGAVPSGNGLAAWTSVRLWRLTGERRYRADAEAVLLAFGRNLRNPNATAFLLRAADALRFGEQGAVDRGGDGVLSLRAAQSSWTVTAGESVSLTLELDLKKGWHVNSSAPVPEGLRASELSVARPFTLGEVSWPKGKTRRLPFLEGPVRLVEGRVSLPVRIEVPANHLAGTTMTRLELTAQPCDDERCLRPRTLRVELPLLVEAKPAG
ncbi:MAG: DUF255 domain-containing protein [Acidobacteriota bacterium]